MCKRGEVGRLTLVQAAAYEQKGEVPDCRFHAHCKIAEAHALVDAQRDEKNNLIEGYGSARWVGDQFRYICDVPRRAWAVIGPRALPRAKGFPPAGASGTSVMQMV